MKKLVLSLSSLYSRKIVGVIELRMQRKTCTSLSHQVRILMYSTVSVFDKNFAIKGTKMLK